MANNNQPTSFIQQMINQRGQDWIVTMTPENIQKNAKRIVRDIARGFIDYDKCGYIFLDPKFTENLIIAIRNELEINTLNYNACTLYYQYYPATPNITVHIAHLEAVCRIYYTILQKLVIVKMTNNVGNLVDIPGLLFSDRNHLANL